MVKMPMNILSVTRTTVKVETVTSVDSKTSGWSTPVKVVRSAPRYVHVSDGERVDLGKINRVLRGNRAPIQAETEGAEEQQTA